MTAIPDSWIKVKMKDVVKIQKGKKPSSLGPKSSYRTVPYITISSFETRVFSEYAPEQDCPKCNNADSLIVWDGSRAGLVGSGVSGFIGSTLARVTSDVCHPRFLNYFLKLHYKTLNSQTRGVGVPHLDPKIFGAIEFPLAPLNEQSRIIDKLDELLSDLDAGLIELNSAKTKLERYRQSILKYAVEGKLTEQWRQQKRIHGATYEPATELLNRILVRRRTLWEESQLTKYKERGQTPPQDWRAKYRDPVKLDAMSLPKLPEGWIWANLDMLGEIASGLAKGTKENLNAKYREVPYLRVANVQRGYLNLSEVKKISATEKDIQELTLKFGDILFNEGGDRDKLGRGCVWKNELEECIHQNHVFRMRPYVQDLIPELISHHGNTYGQQWFSAAGKQSTNLASINMSVLRQFPVPLAPYEEQKEIFSIIKMGLDEIERQEGQINLLIDLSNIQRRSILNDAFLGKLVEQCPSDESAMKLLERINPQCRSNPTNNKAKLPIREVSDVMKSIAEVLKDAGTWIDAQEAFKRCGVSDNIDTERIEELYIELRELDKAKLLEVKRTENSDELKYRARED